MLDNFLLIFVCMTIGYALKFSPHFPKDAAMTLGQFVIYVSLPAMVLLQIPKLTLSMDLLIPVVVAWSVMAVSAMVVLVSARIFAFSKEITGALLLVAVLGNSSFLGIPIIEAYFGHEALGYVIAYDQLGTFLALATYGTVVASYYSHKSEISAKLILQKIFTFPPFIALIVALFLMGKTFPAPIAHVLFLLSQTIVPLALVVVGLQLNLKLPRESIKPFSVALVIKLVVSPIAAILLCALMGWNEQSARVATMEAGMAPMITAGVLASLAGLSPALSSAIVGYGIVLSLATTWVISVAF